MVGPNDIPPSASLGHASARPLTTVRRLAGRLRLGLRAALRANLRARMALGIGLPLLLIFTGLSFLHYWRASHLLEEQARLTAVQFGHVITASLRHSMLSDDGAALATILGDIGSMPAVERAQIVNIRGEVVTDSGAGPADQVQHVVEPGCTACHRLSPERRPTTLVTSVPDQALRIAIPINNEPECAGCHTGADLHLGILLVDVPLRILWPHVTRDLQVDLVLSLLITLLITGAVYWLLHRLVIQRVEAFRAPLALYAAGQFEARLPAAPREDELGALATAFNRMADRIEAHAAEEQALSELRHRAIVEERERIARELHDGLAQVLGYVHTKATAVRLLLKRSELAGAEAQLMQLEEAARGLFVDVREAILGLKMTGRHDARLVTMLGEYAEHFSRLSDLPVEVNITPSARKIRLRPEIELQLLRLVQEALTNARKHAGASRVWITYQNGGPTLELSIGDDGCGFDPEAFATQPQARPHFGLATMRERAEAIGAEFSVRSRPGGTCVSVRLPVPGS